ncbi:MAG TPA: LamG-like jellyroll fold domain-containing protein [Verrucomicrobiae bacterium]|nr:LamG-like jellyroll fold domain-containing protein [Verrucomicrobiae bacterium]
MKIPFTKTLFAATIALLMAAPLHAANFTTALVQGTGTDWTAAIWTNATHTTAVSATASNTYEVLNAGAVAGLVRSPTSAGTPGAAVTFAGDSMQLDGSNGLAGASIRLKGPAGTTGASATPAYYSFGAVNGVILNGGFLANGDDDIGVITGNIRVIANSGIYGGQDPNTINTVQQAGGFRGFVFNGTLSGTGDLLFGNAVLGTLASGHGPYTNANFVFSGDGSSYSGNITVVMGWLQAASGNGFGKGNITIAGTSNVYVVGGSGTAAGPAQFDATVPFSTPGDLTIANTNSFLLLDNSMAFGAVTIDGISLTNGFAYTASEINALTGQTNVIDPTGTNEVTVGQLFQPPIVSAPGSELLLPGSVATFSVSASGSDQENLTYAWQKGGAPLNNNPPHITGATTPTLVITGVTSADVGNYSVAVTGVTTHLTTTSVAASLNTITPNTYQTALLGANPTAYYSLSETGDPTTGTLVCFDSLGAANGTYGTAVLDGVPGPRPADGFPNFSPTNDAATFVNGSGASAITLSALNLDTNAVTLSAWIYPTAPESGGRGIIFSRDAGTVAGLCYNTSQVNGDYQIAYNWGNDTNTFGFQSGLFAPQNQWSFVAVAVSATNATLYVVNSGGLQTATHVYPHAVQSFSGRTLIGGDSGDGGSGDGGSGSRGFNGSIDEVAIFNSTLTEPQLLAIYGSASGVSNFIPRISVQPLPAESFAGGSAAFTVTQTGGTTPLSYQWYKGNVPLVNGPTGSGSTIFGATSVDVNIATLIISNITSTDVGSYKVVVSNSVGTATGGPAALSLVSPSGEGYEAAVLTARPDYFYELNETADTSTGTAEAFDFEGGNNGTYGTGVEDGVAGPRPSDGFPNFFPTNNAAFFNNDTPASTITTPGWNLNGNNLTITAWINPSFSADTPFGIVVCRNGVSTGFGGLCFSATNAPGANHDLAYNWGDSPATTNWISGLDVPPGQWSFVAVSITPTNAVLYMINANGLSSAVNTFNHAALAFSAPVSIGGDPIDGGSGVRTFPGSIDDVAIFKRSLSQSELLGLYTAASGVSTFAPQISVNPTNVTVYQVQTAQFSIQATGVPTPSYQWQQGITGSGGPYTNINNSGQFSGANSPTLTISNVDFPNALDYIVVVSNPGGTVMSAPATLSVLQTNASGNVTLTSNGVPVIEVQGQDWNTLGVWSDGQAVSNSAVTSPFDTYEVPVNAILRSPTAAAAFPGRSLTIDGNGIFVSGAGTNVGSSTGEFRIKATPITVPKLVMNGGQIDESVGGSAGGPPTLAPVVLNGEIDILANTPFYNDTGNDEGLTINSLLTGTGNVEFRDQGYSITNGNTMNIANSANTYSGTWDVIQGTLLGTGTGALGTNNITIGTTGALETTYDLNAPHATLMVNGKVLLHQNDTFLNVVVGGTSLAAGNYPFATLASSFPDNFPANWPIQTGSTMTNASGSITVLVGSGQARPTIHSSFANGQIVLSWSNAGLGILQSATNAAGPWAVVSGATSPYTNSISTNTPQLYFRLRAQ